MKIQILSDLHIEFQDHNIQYNDDAKETVLVLAGDCFLFKNSTKYVEILSQYCNIFKHVLLIPGNHEFYKSSIIRGPEKLSQGIEYAGIKNFTLLNKSSTTIDGVKFVGCTLWADFERDPAIKNLAQEKMNDYKRIRHGTTEIPWKRKLNTNDTLGLHLEHKQFIENEIQERTVVITHHAPSYESIAEEFKGDMLNGAYMSELDEMIKEKNPVLWIHGHVHNSFDYYIGSTRVLCNPKGYPDTEGSENKNFQEVLIVEI